MSVDVVTQSRFTLTAKPVLNPGCCSCCGNVDIPVINWLHTRQVGFKIDRIYLCEACLLEAGSFFGMLSEVKVLALRNEIEDLKYNLDQERAKNAAFDPSTEFNSQLLAGLQSALKHPSVSGLYTQLVEETLKRVSESESPVRTDAGEADGSIDFSDFLNLAAPESGSGKSSK